MHFFALLTVLITVSTSIATSDVLQLTDKNFDDEVKKHDFMLVEFYAPWCGHCKKLGPELEKAATILSKNDPPIPCAKVDCTNETETCKKHGVTGYPTMQIFRNGKPGEEYSGPRLAHAIVAKLKVKSTPIYRILNNTADHQKLLSGDSPCVIGYFDSDSHPLKDDLIKVAEQLAEKARFAYTTKKELLEKYKQKNQIVLYQPKHLQSKHENASVVINATGDKLKTAILENINGLCGVRTLLNTDDFEKTTIVIYYPMDYEKDPKGTNSVRDIILPVAKKLSEEKINVRFAISNTDEFERELNKLGIDEVKKDEKYVFARGPKDEKYKLSEELTCNTLETFARKLAKGELERHIKSQPVPKQTGDVKEVVGKTFDEIVNDKTKDVLIEFYAPWCGHCKTLAPKYEELAKEMKKESNVVIARIDATENDVPDSYKFSGFPTIFFAGKNSKNNPKKFDGDRDVDGFINFLCKQATDPLSCCQRDNTKKKGDIVDNGEL